MLLWRQGRGDWWRIGGTLDSISNQRIGSMSIAGAGTSINNLWAYAHLLLVLFGVFGLGRNAVAWKW